MKKTWRVEFYWYNLTEKEQKHFYTEIGACLYAMYISKHYGFRVHVTHLAH